MTVVIMERAPNAPENGPTGKNVVRAVALPAGEFGLQQYVSQRPLRWRQRWAEVEEKLGTGQLRCEFLRASQEDHALRHLTDFLCDLYRLRFKLRSLLPSHVTSSSSELPGHWFDAARHWNQDGTLRWLLAFDGSTPMSIELIREVHGRWECHCAGFDFGVQEADPTFASLAMVFMCAEREHISRLVVRDESREIDFFDWGLLRDQEGEPMP